MTPLEAAIELIGRNGDSLAWSDALYQLLISSTDEEQNELLGSSRLSRIQQEVHARLDDLDEERLPICKKLAAVATPPVALLLFTPETEY